MYACCRADQSLGYGMSLSCHHSVETPSMIDPRWNMLDWRSKGIFHKVCWGMVGCDGGTTSFYFGITYVCFIPRMLVFVMGLQYQHRFFLYWCQKIAFEGHEQNRKNICRLKTLMGFVGQILIELEPSFIQSFLQSPLWCALGSNHANMLAAT